jgi:hypothetical protein
MIVVPGMMPPREIGGKSSREGQAGHDRDLGSLAIFLLSAIFLSRKTPI